jgi:hypothetical protein
VATAGGGRRGARPSISSCRSGGIRSFPCPTGAQKGYLKAIWTALLKAADATSVTFIDATGTTASFCGPSVYP